jgi:glyoxylase-like metal-dependent hydrolase (beta-lactamase superfamily II)/rhodanese-related sulfurtransferase
MIFEAIRTGGCLSYLIGCDETAAAIVIDPEVDQLNRYIGLAHERGLTIRYVLDTHSHADHFSAVRELSRRLGVPSVMHRSAPPPFIDMRVDDGELLIVGHLRLAVMHTPGHTSDSISLRLPDRVLTGDALLIGATGRTDLPTGDPEALYDSLFGRLLQLDDALRIYPAHDYKERLYSTIGDERAHNVRLQKRDRTAFVEMMRAHNPSMPSHLTEALRTNRSGGKTAKQLIAEAAEQVPFMSMEELCARVRRGDEELVVLDVREKEAFESAHLPRARHVPRGLLELRADVELPDPTVRIVTYCQFGKISTLAAATLRTMGFTRAVALDGGLDAWVKAGFPVERRPAEAK